MRTIMIIIAKEFKQIFRNKMMLPIIFVMPLIQLIILAYAVTFEIKGLQIGVVDKDNSSISQKLINKISGNNFFEISHITKETKEASKYLERGGTDLYLVIPSKFEYDLIRESRNDVLVAVDAIDGSKAGVSVNYLMNIFADFNADINEEYGSKVMQAKPDLSSINIVINNWYNEELDYKAFMVPGILVLLVTMIGAFLSSMNIVREKEIGTIEQINVTPVKKHEFIIGKVMPFWIISMFELAFGMAFGLILYDIPFLGSPVLIFLFASVYLLVVLGMGLFISTVTETQQQAMFISWFFLVIFILLSGLFTAIENMPEFMQYLTYLNPVRYFIEVIRMIMLKGSGFGSITFQFGIIALFAVILNALAVIKYRKVG